jgi:hypothetical protein
MLDSPIFIYNIFNISLVKGSVSLTYFYEPTLDLNNTRVFGIDSLSSLVLKKVPLLYVIGYYLYTVYFIPCFILMLILFISLFGLIALTYSNTLTTTSFCIKGDNTVKE